DPAMGSGHFLVEATDRLARALVQAWAMARPEDETEEVAEHDIHWARREVVRNCIYGVDLNLMAVELAKLSLWLTTVASNKPLSFLDHHLRCGNSLVGAELDALVALPSDGHEREPLFWSFLMKSHAEALIRQYGEIAALPDDDLKTVKWKEARFRKIENSELNRRLKEVANLWISTYFGNDVPEDGYAELQNRLSAEKYPDWSEFRAKDWFRRAQEMGAGRRFFHWVLEFPEVFFDVGGKKDNPGWDAVVGNPPYVRQEVLGELKGYFAQSYETYHGVADLYVYFVELGMSLLRKGGQFSYIMANKWMRANYGGPLRRWMVERCIEEIVDFGDLPVFPEATTYPCILRLCGNSPRSGFEAAEVETLDFDRLEDYVNENSYTVNLSGLDDSGWSLVDESAQVLLEKLRRSGVPLGEYVEGKIYYGIKTGLNEAFVIDEETRARLIAEDPRSAELIKPFLAGRDIKRYESPEYRNYLIFTRRGVNIEDYPAIERHLAQFKDRLMPRPKDWSGAWKGRKPGSYKWYEVQDTIDYYEEFENPKIFWPEIAGSARFTFDSNGLYSNNKAYIIPEATYDLLALLNSSLIRLFVHNSCTDLQGNSFNFSAIFIEKTPIRRISFTTPEPERARFVSQLKDLYAAGNFEEILSHAEACLPKDAEGNFVAEGEKSDVIHDLLAFLAEQMMELNKQKQSEIESFLRWLEEETGAKVDALTNKTRVRAYYELDHPGLLAILKKNKRKLGADPTRRKFQDDLRREYEDSMATLGPLLARIEETDRLIDLVVYKLYGLTDEEIKIVEGNAG
ncbi:MAG: Eco57I restriction-modification methylase domain-containing protein, partial [Methanotrichaceae archaeon]